jgi:beta-glucanase (GH16 family)
VEKTAKLPRRETLRRMVVLFVIGVVQVGLFAGLASAGVLDFTDDFNTFNANRWTKGNHNLGRSYLDPNNVGVSNGNLGIKLPAGTLKGGEIVSNNLYGYGSYTARIKVPYAPSSITGFFLYYPPDYASEVDIEIYNDSSRRIIFATYARGRQTHSQTMTLPFDPTAGFHEYRFDYASGSIKFYADGRLMKKWTNGLPHKSMKLYVNAWYPTWLEGRKPATDRFVLVDKIRYAQQ